MTLKAREIDAALVKKGFVVQPSHHAVYWFYLGGKKSTINTKISHGEREIGDPLISKMSRQMHLTKDEFVQFVQCTMSGDTYCKKMVEDKHVTPIVVPPPAAPPKRFGRF